jgi:hypothetical protein
VRSLVPCDSLSLVVPAQAGTQWSYRHRLHLLNHCDIHVFSAPFHGAGYFPFGVGARLRATASNKSQAAVHGSLPGPHIPVRALVSTANAIEGIG